MACCPRRCDCWKGGCPMLSRPACLGCLCAGAPSCPVRQVPCGVGPSSVGQPADLWHFRGMPAPTSPRKKSLMPSTELRRRLRAAGHALSPVVQVGKLGTTNAVLDQVTCALRDHELIKVKLGSECPET